jgi:hypothetical protein
VPDVHVEDGDGTVYVGRGLYVGCAIDGVGKFATGTSASAAVMKLCQISAGIVPPYTG